MHRFGKGYTVTLKAATRKTVCSIIAFIRQKFPGAIIKVNEKNVRCFFDVALCSCASDSLMMT